MEFGSTLTNPLLQVAVSAGEATIWHACEAKDGLRIHAEMEQYPDGRDAIRVTLRSGDRTASFSMLLRKYFDRPVLWRVARRAWQQRAAGAEFPGRLLDFGHAGVAAMMN